MNGLWGDDMKQSTAGLVFLAALTSTSGLQAASPEEALCRGDYPVMLMTDFECRQHVRQVKLLRAKGQTQALQALQQQHAELLRERAAVCPCMEHAPEATPKQQLVSLGTDC